MYNRAKYHPHTTDDMKKAMIIFKKWLKNYPKLKALEDKKLIGSNCFLLENNGNPD